GYADYVPFHDGVASMEISIEGRSPTGGAIPSADYHDVSAGFLETLRVPLLSGRTISEQDMAQAAFVAVVSREFAHRYYPGEDPLGQKFHAGDPSTPALTIIGVVGDTAKTGGLEKNPDPQVYFPGAHFTRLHAVTLVLRSSLPSAQTITALRDAVHAEDPAMPVSAIRKMSAMVSASLAGRQFNLLLLGVFAGLAIVLAAVGIFGVMSYSVTQRTQEIGVRMALGAQPADILRLTLGQGLRLVVAGLAFGLAGAFALTRLMSSLLYSVTAHDPVTFVGVPLLFAAVALLACWLPSRRAARVSPMMALKYE
ncbi:MAG: FtsX-like permease family protein, partial [Bryobacteraceae bacterium]